MYFYGLSYAMLDISIYDYILISFNGFLTIIMYNVLCTSAPKIYKISHEAFMKISFSLNGINNAVRQSNNLNLELSISTTSK